MLKIRWYLSFLGSCPKSKNVYKPYVIAQRIEQQYRHPTPEQLLKSLFQTHPNTLCSC
jgi:hypothetical protein